MLKLVPALAVLALAVLAPPAVAAKECNRAAKVTSGTVFDLTRTKTGEDGVARLDETPIRNLSRGPTYVAAKDSTVTFQDVRYLLENDTVFALGCFGHSRKEGTIFPAVKVLTGTISARPDAGKPGGITANEGLWDPYASKAVNFSVTRTGKGEPTIAEILEQGPGALRFGTAKVRKSAASGGYLNITPYVGSKPGLCRQASGGDFTSTRLDSRGYFKGTSKFIGLASFSPR